MSPQRSRESESDETSPEPESPEPVKEKEREKEKKKKKKEKKAKAAAEDAGEAADGVCIVMPRILSSLSPRMQGCLNCPVGASLVTWGAVPYYWSAFSPHYPRRIVQRQTLAFYIF